MDCDEFRELLAELDPRYLVPGHAANDKEMTKIFVLNAKVSAKLKDSRKVSLCADTWTKKGMTGFSKNYSTLLHSSRPQAVRNKQ